nr:uncharacterized protein LOC111759253 [Dasypus novemcinctus]
MPVLRDVEWSGETGRPSKAAEPSSAPFLCFRPRCTDPSQPRALLLTPSPSAFWASVPRRQMSPRKCHASLGKCDQKHVHPRGRRTCQPRLNSSPFPTRLDLHVSSCLSRICFLVNRNQDSLPRPARKTPTTENPTCRTVRSPRQWGLRKQLPTHQDKGSVRVTCFVVIPLIINLQTLKSGEDIAKTFSWLLFFTSYHPISLLVLAAQLLRRVSYTH